MGPLTGTNRGGGNGGGARNSSDVLGIDIGFDDVEKWCEDCVLEPDSECICECMYECGCGEWEKGERAMSWYGREGMSSPSVHIDIEGRLWPWLRGAPGISMLAGVRLGGEDAT